MNGATPTPAAPDGITKQKAALAALRARARAEETVAIEAEEAVVGAPAPNPFSPAAATLQEVIAAGVGAQQLAMLAGATVGKKTARDLAIQLGLTRGPKVPYADNSEENARRLVEHFMAGRLWLDVFTQRVMTTIEWNDPQTPCQPRAWEDIDDDNATVFLQRMAGPKIRKTAVQTAIEVVASANRQNQVVDWLNSLTWDGTARLDTVITRLLGTPDTPYHTAVGRNLFLSLVARAMTPGCKVDEMVVLEGPQGALKSTVWEVLGGERYFELGADPDHKDFQQQLRGVWLGELPEMSALRRTTVERIKGMLTIKTDRYRPSFGRHEKEYARQTVFVGTTNQDKWLQDDTGNRRFIPVRVGKIDIPQLRQERDQLFAEAVTLFKQGQPWWNYPALETAIMQEVRYVGDPWLEQIRDAVVDLARRVPPQPLTVVDILGRLGVPVDQQDKPKATRVGVALKKLGGVVKVGWLGGTHGTPVRTWTFPRGVPK